MSYPFNYVFHWLLFFVSFLFSVGRLGKIRLQVFQLLHHHQGGREGGGGFVAEIGLGEGGEGVAVFSSRSSTSALDMHPDTSASSTAARAHAPPVFSASARRMYVCMTRSLGASAHARAHAASNASESACTCTMAPPSATNCNPSQGFVVATSGSRVGVQHFPNALEDKTKFKFIHVVFVNN